MYDFDFYMPTKDAAPIVAITTSAGTGSEVDCCAVLSNDEVSEENTRGARWRHYRRPVAVYG